MKIREFHPPHIYKDNTCYFISASIVRRQRFLDTDAKRNFDRFPRNERDFWTYFNYIHINPIKHGYVRVSDGILIVEGKQVKIAPGHTLDVHQCLAQYPHSSYHYYVREYGEEFLTDAWMWYPIPGHGHRFDHLRTRIARQ